MKNRIALALVLSLVMTGCTYNPFTTDNHLTGTATGTAVGAGVGAGAAALIGQTTKPGPLIAGGLIGAVAGYYVSTLRFASGGVIQAGGQVFTLGDYVAIEIPTDNLFEVNTSDFLDDAGPILNSTVAILKRYPDNNIMISGNTSGFSTSHYELKLSEARARQVAAYLWTHGIGQFLCTGMQLRKLTYTGYGNYFPIANDLHNPSIRQNSRIQITAYPSKEQLQIDKRHRVFNNIGDDVDEPITNDDVKESLAKAFPTEGAPEDSSYK